MALTLHNALYQGSLMETLDASSWEKIEQALQLPCARALTEYEGDFNMLHSVVHYIRHHQRGEGIVGVSHQYGAQVAASITYGYRTPAQLAGGHACRDPACAFASPRLHYYLEYFGQSSH